MQEQKTNSLPYVLKFNGENSHIVLPNININYSQGFTIEAWVYYNSFKYIPAIINFSNVKKDNIILMSRNTALILYIKLQTSAKVLQASNIIELDKWIHLAATVDSSGNGKLYKNGIEVKSGEMQLPQNLNRTINYIGRSTLTQYTFFDGRMSEVRFWKCSRTVEELQQNLHRRLEENEPELVGYWPLNEGTGDVSHDGKIINSTWHQELYLSTDESNSFREQESVLSFRGLTNYLNIKDPVFDDREFTISLWVKPTNLNDGNSYGLIGNNAAKNQYDKLELWLTAEQSGLAYDSYDSTGNRFHEQLNDFFIARNQWVHITWVKEGTEYRFYRDGELFATKPAPSSIWIKNQRNYCIGRSETFWNGQIAALSIWCRPRSQAEINADLYRHLTGKETDLVGYWPLDEGKGDTLTNKVIAQDGNIIGATTWEELNFRLYRSSRSRTTNQDYVLNFNGLDNYINCGDRINLANTSFSIEFWAKRNSTKAVALIIAQGIRQDHHGLHIGFRENDVFTLDFHGNGINTDTSITDTQWHHWCCVYDASTKNQIIYRDGKKITEGTAKENYQGTGDLYIGNWVGNWAGCHFSGQITEVRIWKKVRTEQEIKLYFQRRLIGNELGLIAYWPLNEGTGNVAHDQAKINNLLTIHGATWEQKLTIIQAANHKNNWNNFLSFDGVDDYVEVPYQASLNSSKFTLSAWVKVTGKQGNWRSILVSRDVSPKQGYMLYASNKNKWQFSVGISNNHWTSIFGPQVVLNTWTFIAATYDGSKMKLYINGELVSEKVADYVSNSSRYLRIGSLNDKAPQYFFPGQIAEVQVWDKVCTLEELQNNMQDSPVGNESGLAGYWPLHEGSDNTAYDQTTNAQHGTIAGAIWQKNQTFIKSALEFDGVDDYVDIGKKPEFKIEKNLTIEAWIFPEQQKKWSGIFGNIYDTNSTESGYGLCLDGKSGVNFACTPGNQGIKYLSSGNNTLILSQWQHITGTYDGQEMKVYVNGVLKATQAIAANQINYNPENNLRIGIYKDNNEAYSFQGNIAEVRLWNCVRSEAEIQSCMYGRLIGDEPGLVGYWSVNEGKGNHVSDKTSYANSGEIIGATWETTTRLLGEKKLQLKSVLNFQPDFVEIPEPFENNNEFTISLWVKPKVINDGSTSYAVIGKETDKYCKPSLWLSPENSALIYDSYDTEGTRYREILANFFVDREKWIHITWVKQGSDYKFYRNGELFATKPAPETFYSNKETGYCLGRVDNYSWFGEMANVSIWNIARTDTDIKNSIGDRFTGKEPGLVGYWPLNDGSGTTVTDSTSSGNDGKIKGAIWDWQVFFSNEKLPQSELEKQQNSEQEQKLSELQQQNVEQDKKDAELAQKNQEQDTQLSQLQKQNAQLNQKLKELSRKTVVHHHEWQQLQKLQPNDLQSESYFGEEAALSGEWAIAGARKADRAGIQDAGIAYIFQLENKMWVQKQQLQPDDTRVGDQFGSAVAINPEWAIIGARKADYGLIKNTGAAYIYQLLEGIWQPTQKLQPADLHTNSCFGKGIVINGDWGIIGAPYAKSATIEYAGAAYVYRVENGLWEQKQKLQPQDLGINQCFGNVIAMGGEWAIIGGGDRYNSASIKRPGGAYIYRLENGLWQLKQKLNSPQPGINDLFGYSVAISGEYAFVGAVNTPVTNILGTGTVYIYKLIEGVWQPQQTLQPTQPKYCAFFGATVAIANDIAVIGSTRADSSRLKDIGNAYIFQLEKEVWQLKETLQPSDLHYESYFGFSTPTNKDWIFTTAAWANNATSKRVGAVYVFASSSESNGNG